MYVADFWSNKDLEIIFICLYFYVEVIIKIAIAYMKCPAKRTLVNRKLQA